MTWRKLYVLVTHLPPESATATQRRLDADDSGEVSSAPPNPDAEQWGRADFLLASIRDEMHFFRHHYLQSKSKTRLKWQPEPLPRPGIGKRRGITQVSAEQTNLLARHLALMQGDSGE